MFQKGAWQSRWARVKSSRDLWCLWFTSTTHSSFSSWRRLRKSMALIRRAPSPSLATWRSLGTSKAWLIGRSPSTTLTTITTIMLLGASGFDYQSKIVAFPCKFGVFFFLLSFCLLFLVSWKMMAKMMWWWWKKKMMNVACNCSHFVIVRNQNDDKEKIKMLFFFFYI